jgi:peptide/nickel transport system substrate-binding protein
MAELPTGTVTFLFTDIEGSTQLVKQLRDDYGDVLAAHQILLREAFMQHGGQEIDTQGDAFFVAFRRARDAVSAAVDGQRALAAHAWPAGIEVRVRMGLHTAEPAVGADRYTGLGVHRGARIMAAGHGGQILMSEATRAVLEDEDLPGVELRDLGDHRLKDLDRPGRIYQVDAEGLPDEFPALRTLEAPTAYTGLEDELAEAARAAVWHERFLTRRRIAAAAVLAVGVATAAFAILGRSETERPIQIGADALGLIDTESAEIVGQVDVGATPTGVAHGEGAVWVANADLNRVTRVDPERNLVVDTIPVGSSPSRIAVGGGAVWVTNSLDGNVSRIDPETNTVVQTIPVGTFPVGIVHTAGSLWVANTGDSTVTRIDADTGTTETFAVAATELAVGDGTLWASDRTANRVTRIDPISASTVHAINVGNGPEGVSFGEGAAWVANSQDGTVSRIDPATNAIVATIRVGNDAAGVATGGGSVWVANRTDGTIARIDPQTHEVERVSVGNRPQGVTVRGDDVLVTVRQSAAGHRGGTLRVRTDRDVHSIDTAVAYDTSAWIVLRMTNDGLVGFNQAGGLQGTQLVPDLALALPTPTDGGRTYTFRLRANVRFSTGRTVMASDVRSTFERLFKVGELPVVYYDGLIGASRCRQVPAQCDLSQGIVANDSARLVSFRLTEPDPEFLYKLALPFAYVLPAQTPARKAGPQNPLPATGPYVIADYRTNRVLRLRRNPRFRQWAQAAQPTGYPDEIVFEIGGTPDDAVRAVIRGEADLFTSSQSQNVPSQDELAEIKTRYASQVRTNPQASTIGLFLNTRVPPFDRVDVRRAVSYAADRAAAVEAAGGRDVAQLTCQILPPSFPGYRPYCPYGTPVSPPGPWAGPDLAKARALVAASGTRGMSVNVWSWADKPWPGRYAVQLLRSLGYRASLRSAAGFDYFEQAFDSRTKAQIGTWEWISDYPAASGFFSPILTCAAFLPNDPANSNAAEFCDPRIDREIARAAAEQVTDPAAARERWARIDAQTVDAAPLVPLANPKAVDVLSKRVGNYQYSPQLGVLIDQLWVQ